MAKTRQNFLWDKYRPGAGLSLLITLPGAQRQILKSYQKRTLFPWKTIHEVNKTNIKSMMMILSVNSGWPSGSGVLQVLSWLLLFCFCLCAVPSSIQGLFLAVHLGITLVGAPEAIYGAKDWIQASCVQGKHLTPVLSLKSLSVDFSLLMILRKVEFTISSSCSKNDKKVDFLEQYKLLIC